MTVRLVLFGAPTIAVDGEAIALPFERRSQLLVYLALKRAWVGRAELAALLWPEQQSKLAYTNLRKTLFRLQSLQGAPTIELQGGAARLDIETDVTAFESALQEQRVTDALALRRGELLTGFDDDDNEAWSGWLRFERDRLRAAWRGAALRHLAGELDPGDGIVQSQHLLDADPLDEAALRAHMSWLARNGQTGRARQVYREFVERLASDLGLAPNAELKAFHASLASTAAPLVPPEATQSSSPLDAGFVGRTVELKRIAALLAQGDCRLLTLIGPGGTGKTRLAQRVMKELAPRYADGTAFVPLEDVSSPVAIGGRVARELGVGAGKEPLGKVIDFLRERQMLLVLDNFEHLAADASILNRLLNDCLRLEIIVTSRVRLAVASEWLMPVEGLPCPEPEDLDRVEAFDAARLFIQTARRVEPALDAAAEAASIVDICRQVEGLPLALELAAAWVRVLPCAAIAAELRKGSELLHAADGPHPARHASFEVVFDQSWQLLTPIERAALARLSVFLGGFTAEAARAVTGASLPVLGALADKSLLRKEGTRLFMHPLVQQLAARRLDETGLRETTERAHGLYFHRLMVQLAPAVQDGDRAALQSMDADCENCMAAWIWAVEHEQGDALMRSVSSVVTYSDYRGRPAEALVLVREAIETRFVQADASLHTLLLSKASHLEYRLNRYAEAEATARRALEAARHSRDRAARIQSLTVLASCGLHLGRLADARRHYKQALALATAGDQAHHMAATLDNLALVEKRLGHYDEALRLSIESLAQHRHIGDTAGVALCLNNLGDLYMVKREYDVAATHLREGLVISERDGLVTTRSYILANLSEVAMKMGDLDSAESCARRALDIAEAAGSRAYVSQLKLQLTRIAVRSSALAAARAALAAGLEDAIAVRLPVLKLVALVCFAEILAAQGESACAQQVLRFTTDHPFATAPLRDEASAVLATLPASASAIPVWPGLELDELLHRIIVETGSEYASLIALLGNPG